MIEFVRWWGETVTPNKGGDRQKGEKRGTALFVSEAESLTDLTQQQVSKWRRRLKDPESYRAMLFGAAYHKAMADTNNTTATKWTGDRGDRKTDQVGSGKLDRNAVTGKPDNRTELQTAVTP